MHDDRPLAVVVPVAGGVRSAADDQAAAHGRSGRCPVPHRGGVVGDLREHRGELFAGDAPVHRGDDPDANGRCDEVLDDAGARDGTHRMCDGAVPGGEGLLKGDARPGRGAGVVFEPRVAAVANVAQDEDGGDGKSEAARAREQCGHGARRCGHHVSERESEAKPGESAPGRGERQGGWGAGLDEGCASGPTH